MPKNAFPKIHLFAVKSTYRASRRLQSFNSCKGKIYFISLELKIPVYVTVPGKRVLVAHLKKNRVITTVGKSRLKATKCATYFSDESKV